MVGDVGKAFIIAGSSGLTASFLGDKIAKVAPAPIPPALAEGGAGAVLIFLGIKFLDGIPRLIAFGAGAGLALDAIFRFFGLRT